MIDMRSFNSKVKRNEGIRPFVSGNGRKKMENRQGFLAGGRYLYCIWPSYSGSEKEAYLGAEETRTYGGYDR